MNSPETLLSSIAEIFPGYTFRPGQRSQRALDCSVLNMRNVDVEDESLNITEPEISSKEIPDKQLLLLGDILLLAKGNRNVAVVYNGAGKAVASNVFLILRLKDKTIDPYYLAVIINHGELSKQLDKIKAGTSVTNINKMDLEQLRITPPTLNNQKRLVSLFRAWRAEKYQTLQLIEMKETFFRGVLQSKLPHAPIPEPHTDDSHLWVGYELSGLYHLAKIRFRDLIFIKGLDKPVTEFVGIILKMIRYPRTIQTGTGSTETYQAVKEWRVILPYHLRTYNDSTVPQEQKENDIVNTIPHSLIQSITMVDRFGNKVEPINP